jgi:hypothetical protein
MMPASDYRFGKDSKKRMSKNRGLFDSLRGDKDQGVKQPLAKARHLLAMILKVPARRVKKSPNATLN